MWLPVEYTADEDQRVTLVGREADFAGESLELPDSVEAELDSTGPYHPESDGVFADLTDSFLGRPGYGPT